MVEPRSRVVEPGSRVVEPGSRVVEPRSRVVEPVETPAGASSATLRIRSACAFWSRGIQVYVVPAGAKRAACAASGFMSGCLIFQRPDICSTTSLESIRTSRSAPGVCSL